jgi:hypothetical protein
MLSSVSLDPKAAKKLQLQLSLERERQRQDAAQKASTSTSTSSSPSPSYSASSSHLYGNGNNKNNIGGGFNDAYGISNGGNFGVDLYAGAGINNMNSVNIMNEDMSLMMNQLSLDPVQAQLIKERLLRERKQIIKYQCPSCPWKLKHCSQCGHALHIPNSSSDTGAGSGAGVCVVVVLDCLQFVCT